MGSTTEPPIDEQLWQDPFLAVEYSGIHSNSGTFPPPSPSSHRPSIPNPNPQTVLFYFAASPFFDPTSNNASLFTQCMNNASMIHYVETRAAFESRLREMQGLEFVVSHDPLQPPYSPYPYGQAPSNVWVIKKQRRRKQRGMQDEVTVLGVYFVVGETVLMAPKVGDVLASRMVTKYPSSSPN
jgi:mediator of RNA polymerase II transcription subunit 6